MAGKPAIVTPKGERYPGSGRAKGTPNRVSVEVRALVSQLVTDPNYQHKLRQDFQRRRVHPTIEALVWNYHLGKPTQPVAVSGALGLDVDVRLDEEKRIFAQLDIHDLEQLAAESQALVNRALALTQASRASVPNAQERTEGTAEAESGEVATECAENASDLKPTDTDT